MLFKVWRGLEILVKYCENEKGDFVPGHDQIWAGPPYPFDPESVDDEDKAELDRLGWFIDEESWSRFC